MFKKYKTRILFVNGDVVILNQIQDGLDKCRVFIDGIEKGCLIERNGFLVPVDDAKIQASIIKEINNLAKGSIAA